MGDLDPHGLHCASYFRYLVQKKPISISEKHGVDVKSVDSGSSDLQPPPAKRVRRRGQNKGRPRPAFIPYSEMLCPSCYHGDGGGSSCQFGEKCRYSHDVVKYMSTKPPDVGDECFLFKTYGKCPYGRACRFAGNHLTTNYGNVVNESLYDPSSPVKTLNVIPRFLQEKLRKRQLPFVRSERYLKKLKEELSKVSAVVPTRQEQNLQTKMDDTNCDLEEGDQPHYSKDEQVVDEKNCTQESSGDTHVQTCGPLTDQDIVKLKPDEKKKV